MREDKKTHSTGHNINKQHLWVRTFKSVSSKPTNSVLVSYGVAEGMMMKNVSKEIIPNNVNKNVASEDLI